MREYGERAIKYISCIMKLSKLKLVKNAINDLVEENLVKGIL